MFRFLRFGKRDREPKPYIPHRGYDIPLPGGMEYSFKPGWYPENRDERKYGNVMSVKRATYRHFWGIGASVLAFTLSVVAFAMADDAYYIPDKATFYGASFLLAVMGFCAGRWAIGAMKRLNQSCVLVSRNLVRARYLAGKEWDIADLDGQEVYIEDGSAGQLATVAVIQQEQYAVKEAPKTAS